MQHCAEVLKLYAAMILLDQGNGEITNDCYQKTKTD